VSNETLIKAWFHECKSNHLKCQVVPPIPIYPQRYLNINAFAGSDDIVLEETNLTECKPYIALSHCWGTNPVTKTTNGNLESRQNRIKYDDLPLTFKDAVQHCRLLGVDYLWIDSLCIIQDNEKDWNHQAAIMAFIYTRAECTLIAASSEDSTQGCRVDPLFQRRYPISPHLDLDFGDKRIRFFAQSPRDWTEEYGENPLIHRAWTLQEKELSRRAIHFSSNMLLWECKTLKGSSELPWSERTIADLSSLLRHNSAGDLNVDTLNTSLRSRWFEVVEEYSRRFMTYELDKLPAISGVITLIRMGDPYNAGLFRADLPSALLWRTALPSSDRGRRPPLDAFFPRRPMQYRAPSWSWASVDGPISYDSQRVMYPVDDDLGFEDISVLAVHTDQVGGGHLAGPVTNGSIQLKGRLLRTLIDQHSTNPSAHSMNCHLRLLNHSKTGELVGVLCPDVIQELNFHQEIFCLPFCSELFSSVEIPPLDIFQEDYSCQEAYHGDSRLVMGLALVGCNRARPGTYKRVGLIRWMKAKFCENEAIEEIEIL
jgi:hypothetical protein